MTVLVNNAALSLLVDKMVAWFLEITFMWTSVCVCPLPILLATTLVK